MTSKASNLCEAKMLIWDEVHRAEELARDYYYKGLPKTGESFFRYAGRLRQMLKDCEAK